MRIFARGKEHNGTYDTYKIGINDGSTTSLSANKTITRSYDKYYAVFASTPSAATWSWDEIDDLIIGVVNKSDLWDIEKGWGYLDPTGSWSNLAVTKTLNPHTNAVWEWSDFDDLEIGYGMHGPSSAPTQDFITQAYLRINASSGSYYLYPTADGHQIESTPSGQTNNWECIDEPHDAPNDDTDYNMDGGAYHWYDDYFTISTPTGYSGTINSVTYTCRVKGIADTFRMWTYHTGTQGGEIRTTQLYALANYQPPTSTVTLSDPQSLSVNHSRKIGKYTFPSGEYAVDDYGRAGKTLTLTGIETSTATALMQSVKDICHYGTTATITGLDDTNLNTDYIISNFNFYQQPGQLSIYHWSLTLEEE